jgi:hypothetical protein
VRYVLSISLAVAALYTCPRLQAQGVADFDEFLRQYGDGEANARTELVMSFVERQQARERVPDSGCLWAGSYSFMLLSLTGALRSSGTTALGRGARRQSTCFGISLHPELAGSPLSGSSRFRSPDICGRILRFTPTCVVVLPPV